jgi:hypothetical protein
MHETFTGKVLLNPDGFRQGFFAPCPATTIRNSPGGDQLRPEQSLKKSGVEEAPPPEQNKKIRIPTF